MGYPSFPWLVLASAIFTSKLGLVRGTAPGFQRRAPLLGCPDGSITAEGSKTLSHCDGTTGKCKHSTCAENLLGQSVNCTSDSAPGCYGLMCMVVNQSCTESSCLGITVCPGYQQHCDGMLTGNLCLLNGAGGVFSICSKPTPCAQTGAHQGNRIRDVRNHPTRGCPGQEAQHAHTCVVMADSRFGSDDFDIASIKDMKELGDRFELYSTSSQKMDVMRMSLMVNKAYTLKFNYTFLISNLSQYTGKPGFDRDPAWFKIAHLLDVQQARSDCEWILWMDSDAYFWMDGHTVTLERFLSTVSVHEASLDYLTQEATRLRHGGCHAWYHKPHVSFVIGMNGIISNKEQGFPGVYLNVNRDYVCTGVFLIRNDKTGRELLREWWAPTEALGQRDMEGFKHMHPWEQRVLNTYVLPKFAKNTTVYSYHDFGSPFGIGIRHLWRTMAEWRNAYMTHDTDYLMNITRDSSAYVL